MEKIVNLTDLYMELKKIEQLMVTKAEFNRALETISVMSNEDTMIQIRNSEKDIKEGRIKRISSVREL